MEPLRDLLNRIRWDRDFGAGTFELGIYDRVEDAVLRVPLAAVRFEPGDRFAFFLEGEDGQPRTVPLHRVREVYKDGVSIWKREGKGSGRPDG
ncbi:MAG: DUF504 domain-containing protein [Thermodesulfobacteriota bacterium]